MHIDLQSDQWEIRSVLDTRMFERTEKGWKAIPDSGEDHVCDCCGRIHQVWAIVERRADKKVANIGATCAKRASTVSTVSKARLGKSHVRSRLNGGDFEGTLCRYR